MDLRDARCEGVEWIQLARVTVQWRFLVNTSENLQFPQNDQMSDGQVVKNSATQGWFLTESSSMPSFVNKLIDF
jgi:hypothetical protein